MSKGSWKCRIVATLFLASTLMLSGCGSSAGGFVATGTAAGVGTDPGGGTGGGTGGGGGAPIDPLPIPSEAPRFRGVCSTAVAGSTAVRLSWEAAIDVDDPSSSIIYNVYAASTSGGQNFGAPVATTAPGETSVVVTSADFAGISAGSEVFFVVRATDTGLNQDSNSVEVRVTPSSDVFFVDGSGGAGTGTQADPFSTIQAGVDAAETAGGGTVLVAGGTYNERVVLDAAVSTLNLVGGFPSFSGTSAEVDLLATRDVAANLTNIDGDGIVVPAEEGLVDIVNSGSNTLVDGFTVFDSGEANLRAIDSRLQVSCNHFTEDDLASVESGITLDTSNTTTTQNVWVVGNRFDNQMSDGLRSGGGTTQLKVFANTFDDLEDNWFEDDTNSGASDSDATVIPSGQTCLMHFEGNVISRTGDGEFDFEPEADGTAGNLELIFRRNDAFGIDGIFLDIEDFAYFGDGGTGLFEVKENRFTNTEDWIELGYLSSPSNPNDVPDGATTVTIENNLFVNAGSETIEIEDISARANSSATLTIRQNRLEGGDGDAISIQDDNSSAAGAHDGGDITVLIEQNTVSAYHTHTMEADIDVHPGGTLTFDFLNNTGTSNDNFIDFDSDGTIGTPASGTPTSDRIIRFMGNDCEASDDAFEFSIASAGGNTVGVIANNVFRATDDATFEPEVLNNSYIDGTVDLIIVNNQLGGGEQQAIDLDTQDINDTNEVNIYLGRNSLLQSHDRENVVIDFDRETLALIERNEFGLSTEGSNDSVDYDGESVLEARTRFSNNVFAFASSAGIDLNDQLLEFVNNTVYRNGFDAGDDPGIFANNNAEDFSQVFVQNCIVTENSGGDLVGGSPGDDLIQASFSLIGDLNPLTGLGNIVASPVFVFAGEFLDFDQQFRLGASSPARDAGNPDPRFNDPDGSRNDMGAFGGPGAGTIGFTEGITDTPFVTIGMRPFSDLFTGRRLLDPNATLELIFTNEIDPASVNSTTVTVTSDGSPVSGTLNTDGRRVTFAPTAPFTGGAILTVTASGLTDTAGGTLDYPFTQVTSVEPTAVAETEPNDTTGTADALTTPTFRVTGNEVGNNVDFFSVSALSGERLIATVFSSRGPVGVAGDYTLTLLDTDGTTVLTANSDQFSNDNDPYIDFVIETDGTYFLQVEDVSGASTDYELEGYLQP